MIMTKLSQLTENSALKVFFCHHAKLQVNRAALYIYKVILTQRHTQTAHPRPQETIAQLWDVRRWSLTSIKCARTGVRAQVTGDGEDEGGRGQRWRQLWLTANSLSDRLRGWWSERWSVIERQWQRERERETEISCTSAGSPWPLL